MNLILILLLLCIAAVANAQSGPACDLKAGPQALIRAAAERERLSEDNAKNYTWIEREELRKLNSDGTVKSREVRTREFMVIYGQPVRRLLSKDDQPLPDKEKAKQDEKIEKIIRERENETAEQKQKREEQYVRSQREAREFVDEVADAYNFTLLPEEEIAGHPAYVISAEPKPGYQPRHKQAKILPKLHFRVWLNREDCSWVKLDAEAIDTITWGGIVARLNKGTRLMFEQNEVNNEIWLPRHVALKIDARVMLLKKFNQEVDIAYSEYRKFRAETRITNIEEAKPPAVPAPPQ